MARLVDAARGFVRAHYHLRANRDSWGGPLDGQLGRQAMVRDLIARANFDFVVETGTFLGVTTGFLASCTDAPVYSVEVEPVFFRRARRNLHRHPGVHLARGDSRAFLRSLRQREGGRRGFFYLDAHWLEDLPVEGEIRAIAEQWSEAVILADDFEVPGDRGYAFDDFGPGKRLDRSLLPDDALAGYSVSYPALPSADEVGTLRGCVLLTSPSLRELVAASPHIRVAELIGRG